MPRRKRKKSLVGWICTDYDIKQSDYAEIGSWHYRDKDGLRHGEFVELQNKKSKDCNRKIRITIEELTNRGAGGVVTKLNLK